VLTVDATPMGPASNSYVSLDEADAILAAYAESSGWSGAAEAARKNALLAACLRLEQENYHGWPTTNTQALKWPRDGLYRETGYSLTWDKYLVPLPVQRAQSSLANYLLQLKAAGVSTVPTVDPETMWMQSVTVGPINVTYRDHPAGFVASNLPDDVFRWLAPFITAGAGQFQVIRG
jgi:hypothetical protein